MRLISTSKRLAITVLAVLTIPGFGSTAFAQLPGKSPVGSSTPNKNTAPATRTRHANPHRRSSPKNSDQPEVASGGTTPATSVDPLPVPGTEEKKQGIEAYNKEDYDTAIERLSAAA